MFDVGGGGELLCWWQPGWAACSLYVERDLHCAPDAPPGTCQET